MRGTQQAASISSTRPETTSTRAVGRPSLLPFLVVVAFALMIVGGAFTARVERGRDVRSGLTAAAIGDEPSDVEPIATDVDGVERQRAASTGLSPATPTVARDAGAWRRVSLSLAEQVRSLAPKALSSSGAYGLWQSGRALRASSSTPAPWMDSMALAARLVLAAVDPAAPLVAFDGSPATAARQLLERAFFDATRARALILHDAPVGDEGERAVVGVALEGADGKRRLVLVNGSAKLLTLDVKRALPAGFTYEQVFAPSMLSPIDHDGARDPASSTMGVVTRQSGDDETPVVIHPYAIACLVETDA